MVIMAETGDSDMSERLGAALLAPASASQYRPATLGHWQLRCVGSRIIRQMMSAPAYFVCFVYFVVPTAGASVRA